jgi:hypothetical protein
MSDQECQCVRHRQGAVEMKAGCVVFLLFLALPALAEEPAVENRNTSVVAERGGVAQVFFAQELFAMGMARHDALAVLAAARLAAGVGVRASGLIKDAAPEGGADVDAGAMAGPGSAVSASEMLTEARRLAAADEAALSLIDQAEAAPAEVQAGGVSRSPGQLGPGQSDSWSLPFYSSVLAEVAIVGDGRSGLDVRVTDENGNLICARLGPGDRAYCDWVPAWNGYFKVTVTNPGAVANAYALFTN